MTAVFETQQFDRLMVDVMAGSESAIWELAETYTPYIIRAVRSSLPSKLRSKVDSQDFAQSLWASLLLNRRDFTRLQTPQQLVAYLAKATRCKVVDKTRHYLTQKNDVSREEPLANHTISPSARTKSGPLESRDPSPSTMASLRERCNLVFSKLPDRNRMIFQLRLQGCTFQSIAQKLEIDEATARRAIQRMVKDLSE